MLFKSTMATVDHKNDYEIQTSEEQKQKSGKSQILYNNIGKLQLQKVQQIIQTYNIKLHENRNFTFQIETSTFSIIISRI